MVLQMEISVLSPSRFFLSFSPLGNIRMILLLTLFLAYELNSTVEAKALPTKADNVTVVTKNGMHLTIGKQGITGETSYSSYAKVKIYTVGFGGKIAIKAVKMQKYLAMNTKGKVYLAPSVTPEAVFIDKRLSGFISIHSHLHSTKYLTITGTGSVSGGTNTNSDDMWYTYLPTVVYGD